MSCYRIAPNSITMEYTCQANKAKYDCSAPRSRKEYMQHLQTCHYVCEQCKYFWTKKEGYHEHREEMHRDSADSQL
ncbi:unnamed protein product [Peniophora sp. CBMAI 1063]|nr:unnamed protein product [Peniophora sp. CBMAI 1063]